MAAASQHDVVTLHNIDDEDFTFEYNRSEGNPAYTIPKDEVARYPRFLAEHALKHLIDKILTKREVRTSHEDKRMELAEQIIVDEQVLNRPRELTPEEKLRMEVEELNVPSTLEKVLARRKSKKEEKPKEVVGTTPDMDKEPVKVEEKFEGLDKVKVTPRVKSAKEIEKEAKRVRAKPKKKGVVKEAKKVAARPTRNELYTYAEKSLSMVLDTKTRTKLKKMDVDALIKEFDYPMK